MQTKAGLDLILESVRERRRDLGERIKKLKEEGIRTAHWDESKKEWIEDKERIPW